MKITFLGTGTSHGVPTIDCMIDNYVHCPNGVCRKALTDPRYRRTRCSILVEAAGRSLLLDTSQDFRAQMLDRQVRRIDAVLYTHGHADHIYGLPDIRSYCRLQDDAMDIYGSEETLRILRAAFDYVFTPPAFVGGGIPVVRAHLLDGPADILGLHVTPIPVEHGALKGCTGYRLSDGLRDIAYLPDVKVIPSESLELLRGLDILIINCLRYRAHGSHLSLAESLDYTLALRPTRAYFTHLTHDIDAEIEGPRLPSNIHFAYDGLIVEA